MSRTVQLAGAAAFGGILLVVLIAASTEPPPGTRSAPIIVPDETMKPEDLRKTLVRCRTITEPDSACDAAWEAGRRRFFRQESHNP